MKAVLASVALAFLFLATPVPTHAATATFFGPIVPQECHCEDQPSPTGGTITTAPDYGCVLQVIQNVINFGVSLSIILFVIYLTIGGLQIILSGGSSEARSNAKTRLLNVVIGLAVLLCSWLIVDFVMKTLYDQAKFGPWNAILAPNDTGARCIVAKNASTITSGTTNVNLVPNTSGSGGGTGGATGAGSGSTQMNVSSATTYMKQHYSTTKAGGQCWAGVRNGLCGGGLTQFCSPGGYNAYQAGPYLTRAGFSTVYTGTYSYPSTESAFAYQPGDVVIFNPVSGHSNGHSAMYVGNNVWISDFTQNGFMAGNKADYKGGSFSVYRP